MQTVDSRIVKVALERVSGVEFEKFVQAFFSAIFGKEYVPLGGIHDGGADAWLPGSIFENGKSESFLQASITPDARTKIRGTLKRLRIYGRNPKSLTYATSKIVGPVDVLQEELSDELECRIVIRDAAYFESQINHSPQTVQAYQSYLSNSAEFLRGIGASSLVESNANLPARTLCVFVGQELERRRGQTQLLEAVSDSLIIWALEGTDPDKKVFKSRDDIETKVVEALPTAKMFFRGVLAARLEELRGKKLGSRKINYHPATSGYCLPYETRELIKIENLEDETLRIDVSEIFRSRARAQIVDKDRNQELIETCVQVCHSVLHKIFLSQGLELSLFISSTEKDDYDLPSVETHVEEVLGDLGKKGEEAGVLATATLNILRDTFYRSSEKERAFLGKLSRTYILMFLLKNEPRIVEYLRSMAANFQLYVGADIIVRCLSEHMLAPADKMMKNALQTLKSSGSKLILTDKTLDEVWHHLKNSNLEFNANFKDVAQYMTPILAKQISKILVRAYFYYRFDASKAGQKPKSWEKYLSQFCSADLINLRSTRDELREYLVNEYSFEFESDAEMEASIDPTEWADLAEKVYSVRNRNGREEESERILARNAAATILRVYARRKQLNDRPAANPYGYKTWWMTHQTVVHQATGALVVKSGGRYMMRPEFILYFLAETPSKAEIKKSYEGVFPSILGIQLGNRIDEKSFRKVIQDAKDVYDNTNESRAKVVLANASAKLQSDFFKRYDD